MVVGLEGAGEGRLRRLRCLCGPMYGVVEVEVCARCAPPDLSDFMIGDDGWAGGLGGEDTLLLVRTHDSAILLRVWRPSLSCSVSSESCSTAPRRNK